MCVPRQLLVVCLLSLAVPVFASNQIYRYTDDSGTVNFTTELYSIPEKYRTKAVPLEPERPSLPIHQSLLRVVTSSAEYRMSDHDTRTDATRMAVDDAKRQALEQAATYLESVTEVKNLDITRDEIRSYTAGIVTVLNQETSTRLEDGAIVVHVDLTAQVDEHEVIQAIAALRENESAKQELVSLRMETDQLRQQLEAANQALATANTAEQVRALTLQRQEVLNQMQADSLVAEALAGYAYVTPAGVKDIHDLLSRAKQLHPSNLHLPAVSGRVDATSAQLPGQGNQLGGPFIAPSPQSSLATPLAPSPLIQPIQPLPPPPLAAPLGPSPLVIPLSKPNLPTPRPSITPQHSGNGHAGAQR